MGMSSTNLMAMSSGVQAGSSLTQGYVQSQAYKAQGDFESKMAEINARRAEFAAEDALKRGERDAAAVKKRGKQIRGAQRAAMAAQGIEVNDGSAAAIQEETAMMAAEDAAVVKNNAWREAWGYRVSASDSRFGGQMAKLSARSKAAQTFLTGGIQAAGYGTQGLAYYQKGKEGKG